MLFKGLPYINHISIYFFFLIIFSQTFSQQPNGFITSRKGHGGEPKKIKKHFYPKKSMFLFAQVKNKQRKQNSEKKNNPFP